MPHPKGHCKGKGAARQLNFDQNAKQRSLVYSFRDPCRKNRLHGCDPGLAHGCDFILAHWGVSRVDRRCYLTRTARELLFGRVEVQRLSLYEKYFAEWNAANVDRLQVVVTTRLSLYFERNYLSLCMSLFEG